MVFSVYNHDWCLSMGMVILYYINTQIDSMSLESRKQVRMRVRLKAKANGSKRTRDKEREITI